MINDGALRATVFLGGSSLIGSGIAEPAEISDGYILRQKSRGQRIIDCILDLQ